MCRRRISRSGKTNFLAMRVEPSLRVFVSPLMCIFVDEPVSAIGELPA
jgi:hypothetical protein